MDAEQLLWLMKLKLALASYTNYRHFFYYKANYFCFYDAQLLSLFDLSLAPHWKPQSNETEAIYKYVHNLQYHTRASLL